MNKKNFYDTTVFKILKDFNDYLNIYINSSKSFLSSELSAIEKFPNQNCIEKFSNYFELDEPLLRKCIKLFDQTTEIENFILSIVNTYAGNYIHKETTSKIMLSKKRKFQNLLVEDIIILSHSKFKLKEKEFKALRLFSYTLNSFYLASPPGRIAKSTFEKWIPQMSIEDKDFLLSVYNLVDDFYCNQGRINKKNFNKVNKII